MLSQATALPLDCRFDAAAAPAATLAGPTALALLAIVVDDDPVMRCAVCDALRGAGYEVIEDNTAEAALLDFEQSPRVPAVVVSDINLGQGMDGIQLAAAVHARWPRTGVLLMSGEPCPAAGKGEAFLAKPMTSRDLLAEVGAAASSVAAGAASW